MLDRQVLVSKTHGLRVISLLRSPDPTLLRKMREADINRSTTSTRCRASTGCGSSREGQASSITVEHGQRWTAGRQSRVVKRRQPWRGSSRWEQGGSTGSSVSLLESCISQHFLRVIGFLIASLREESVLLAGQYLSMSITYSVCLGKA